MTKLVDELVEKYTKGLVKEISVVVTTYYGVVKPSGKVGSKTIVYVTYDKKTRRIGKKTAKELVEKLDNIGNEKAKKLLKEFVKAQFGIRDPEIYYDYSGNPFFQLYDNVIVAEYVEYDRLNTTGREIIYYTFKQPRIVVD